MSDCGSWRRMGAGMAAGVGAGTVIGTFALKRDAEVRVPPMKKSRKIAKRTRKVPVVLFMLTPEARADFLTPPVGGRCVSATLSETMARGGAPTESDHFSMLTMALKIAAYFPGNSHDKVPGKTSLAYQ